MIDEKLFSRRVELRFPLRRQVHVNNGEAIDERDQIAIVLVPLEQRRITSYAVSHVLECWDAVVHVDRLLVGVQHRVEVGPAYHHQGGVGIVDDAVVLRVVLNLPVVTARGRWEAVSSRTPVSTVNRSSN